MNLTNSNKNNKQIVVEPRSKSLERIKYTKSLKTNNNTTSNTNNSSSCLLSTATPCSSMHSTFQQTANQSEFKRTALYLKRSQLTNNNNMNNKKMNKQQSLNNTSINQNRFLIGTNRRTSSETKLAAINTNNSKTNEFFICHIKKGNFYII
jgi:hypothetical protein